MSRAASLDWQFVAQLLPVFDVLCNKDGLIEFKTLRLFADLLGVPGALVGMPIADIDFAAFYVLLAPYAGRPQHARDAFLSLIEPSCPMSTATIAQLLRRLRVDAEPKEVELLAQMCLRGKLVRERDARELSPAMLRLLLGSALLSDV